MLIKQMLYMLTEHELSNLSWNRLIIFISSNMRLHHNFSIRTNNDPDPILAIVHRGRLSWRQLLDLRQKNMIYIYVMTSWRRAL